MTGDSMQAALMLSNATCEIMSLKLQTIGYCIEIVQILVYRKLNAICVFR